MPTVKLACKAYGQDPDTAAPTMITTVLWLQIRKHQHKIAVREEVEMHGPALYPVHGVSSVHGFSVCTICACFRSFIMSLVSSFDYLGFPKSQSF